MDAFNMLMLYHENQGYVDERRKNMRKTKIVCTLGPATDSREKIEELIQNGMDAARINFSHGDYESHTVLIENLKAAREKLGAPIPLNQAAALPLPPERWRGMSIWFR